MTLREKRNEWEGDDDALLEVPLDDDKLIVLVEWYESGTFKVLRYVRHSAAASRIIGPPGERAWEMSDVDIEHGLRDALEAFNAQFQRETKALME